MSMNIEELTERKSQEQYPNLTILHPNDTLPVIVRDLEKGDMQLIVEFNGKRKVVATIDKNTTNIFMLIRTVGTLVYKKDEQNTYEVNTIKDYYDCIV